MVPTSFPLSITAYVQLSRVRPPVTGVGKHIINSVLGLAERTDVRLTVLASSRDLDGRGGIGNNSPLHALPVRGFPLSLLAMERLWKIAGLPRADRWCDGDDWLWATAESYVPVKRTRYAITRTEHPR